MCEHCGCRGVEPIAELMDEHLALLEIAGGVRRHLTAMRPGPADEPPGPMLGDAVPYEMAAPRAVNAVPRTSSTTISGATNRSHWS